MVEIENLCKASDTLVATEQLQYFNLHTAQRMDLVFTVDDTEYLVDVTTIDANNPSNGFLLGFGLSLSYFPGAASVIAAKGKWDKYLSRVLSNNSSPSS